MNEGILKPSWMLQHVCIYHHRQSLEPPLPLKAEAGKDSLAVPNTALQSRKTSRDLSMNRARKTTARSNGFWTDKTTLSAWHRILFPLMIFVGSFSMPPVVHAENEEEQAAKFLGPFFVQALEKSALEGDAESQFLLGSFYGKGNEFVTQDYAKSLYWLEKSAAQDYAMAQGTLGIFYYHGHGVKQDFVQARQWFEKAAAQGEPMAQFTLGVIYMSGHGVEVDYLMARQWLEKSAAQEEPKAQYHLGIMYENGYGVPQDFIRARRWYKLAAAQGEEKAQARLDNLSEKRRGRHK